MASSMAFSAITFPSSKDMIRLDPMISFLSFKTTTLVLLLPTSTPAAIAIPNPPKFSIISIESLNPVILTDSFGDVPNGSTHPSVFYHLHKGLNPGSNLAGWMISRQISEGQKDRDPQGLFHFLLNYGALYRRMAASQLHIPDRPFTIKFFRLADYMS